MTMKPLLTTICCVIFCCGLSAQGLPVRYWSDDMPQHTFSLGIGPAWFTSNVPFLSMESLQNEGVTPVGFDLALRYDWAYFRGYEVSLAAGLAYMFLYDSYLADPPRGQRGMARVGEKLHYAGVNVLNTKMWFGSRVIWDVCMHMGYAGGVSTMNYEGNRSRLLENGFMAGVSTGVDCLITAWLGVGIHLNAMTGMLYYGDSSSREYSRADVRLGVVYCF